jgi:hypothetical protein
MRRKSEGKPMLKLGDGFVDRADETENSQRRASLNSKKKNI